VPGRTPRVCYAKDCGGRRWRHRYWYSAGKLAADQSTGGFSTEGGAVFQTLYDDFPVVAGLTLRDSTEGDIISKNAYIAEGACTL
jgi:hypothetical protein